MCPPLVQAFEVVQGALVRFSSAASTKVPTAVLVHGILGKRQNMLPFARRLVEGFPHWQVVVVDLRCHGESAAASPQLRGAHGVEAAAADVIRLLSALKLFPEMLIGHSFGGKVVLEMTKAWSGGRVPRPVQVWAAAAAALRRRALRRRAVHRLTPQRVAPPRSGPRGMPCQLLAALTHLPPCLARRPAEQVWVLDALPGEVRSGDMGGADRPADLISTLQAVPLPVPSRHWLISHLEASGFSRTVAAWAATNLAPLAGGAPGMTWAFDLPGIAQMFR